ncbi:MAG: MFS transporter [bacterium]
MKENGLKILIHNPNFFKLWFGNTISRLGDSIDSIAMMWMIYELTGSTILMGTMLVCNFLPNVLFGMFTGVFVDRWCKKRIMVLGDIGRAISVAVVAVLYFNGYIQTWHIYLATFINSTIETFVSPARTAVVPILISDKEDFLAANSLFRASSSFAEIIGLGVAATIIGMWGISTAIMIDAFSFFICAVIIIITYIPEKQNSIPGEVDKINKSKKFLDELKIGIKTAFGNPLIRLSIFLGMALNFFVSPFNVLAPIYSDKILLEGAQGFSLMGMGLAGGMFLGSLLVGQFGSKFNFRKLIISGVLIITVSFISYFFVSELYIAVSISFLCGIGITALSSTVTTLVMTYCKQDVLGRVGSVMNSLMLAAMPMGSMIAGFIGEWYLPNYIFLSMGFLLALLLVSLLFNSTLKTLYKPEREQLKVKG